MPQLGAVELYAITNEFITDVHNTMGCMNCHRGTKGVTDKDSSHKNFIADPSSKDQVYCASCHAEIVGYHKNSVHHDQTGYKTILLDRAGGSELTPDMSQMLDDRCVECHTTCGQCHISQPVAVNGGLIAGHEFRKTPNQTRNCTACHGSRIGAEYKGENAGYEPSVHYLHGMVCLDCHTGVEIHGPQSDAANRYMVAALPKCTNCHDITNDGVAMHQRHGDDLACQVCHSQKYKNCYQCHVAKPDSSMTNGIQIPSEMDFKIGHNPIKSEMHPWEYVLLRHVPIAPDSFAEYGFGLPDYTSLPTWKYTSPHNIQLDTPQNASCDSCHGKTNLFLTKGYILVKTATGDMFQEETDANAEVIVDKVPD